MIDALRQGSSARISLRFRKGGRFLNGLGYTLTAEGKLPSGTTFPIFVDEKDPENGRWDIEMTAEQLSEAGDLSVEFDFIGEGVLNPNARPLILPVRSRHQEAA